MSKFKFPLRIPQDCWVIITQGFKSQELIDKYREAGYNMQFHDAVDAVVGNNKMTLDEMSKATHGTRFVCPFPEAKLVYYDDSGETGTMKADRVQVQYDSPNGTSYLLGGLHFSGLVRKDVYKEGDTIGWLGNSGFVLPAPTTEKPFSGSHIHLTIRVNNVVVDPLSVFDEHTPFYGDDTEDSFDLNELNKEVKTPDEAPRKVARKASEEVEIFAASLIAKGEHWKANILFALATFLKSIGY